MAQEDQNIHEESAQEPQQAPDKALYMQRIRELSTEDQAFLDGYLFAKVTEAAKKGA